MDGDGAVGDRDGTEGDKVGEQQEEAGVDQAPSLLAVPELLADDHLLASGAQVQVAGVQCSRGGHNQGADPDGDHKPAAEVAPCSPADGVGHDHVAVHRYGRQGKHSSERCGRLHEGGKVAGEVAKHPPPLVKGVGGCQRHTEDTHDQVDQGQVTDQEVGGAVVLLVEADEEEQQEVA